RENAVWQRGLAVVIGRMGDVLQAQGKLEAAQEAFEESLTISQRLAEQDANDVGRERDLAIARGRMGLMQVGKDAGRGPTHEERRQIFERHFLFGKLNASEIDGLMAYSRVEQYLAGREIYAKGSPAATMFAVLRGTIKISSPSDDGKEILFDII